VIRPFEKPAWRRKEASRSKRPYKAWKKGTGKGKNVKKRQKGWENEEKMLNEEIVKSGKAGTEILNDFLPPTNWEDVDDDLLFNH